LSPATPVKSKILIEGVLCQTKLKPEERGLFRKSSKTI
jgi:hypothetical protein